MNEIYNAAIRLATGQATGISRLDIQFNYKEQSHSGYLTLMNGNEYSISAGGNWRKEA